MNPIDDQINQAGLFDLLGMSFRGKQAWMAWYMWVMGLAVFCLAVYATTVFLAESDVKSSLGWALLIIGCMQVMVIIKVLAWQQMQKLEILREIRRLELRLSAKQ